MSNVIYTPDAPAAIGPYSQAIVAYREQVSRFYFLEDIMNVKGIGEKTALGLIQKYHSIENIYNEVSLNEDRRMEAKK